MTRFEFWGGAEDNTKRLTYEEIERIGKVIEELYPEGIYEININDLFWFEFESVLEWLRYKYNKEKDKIIR